MDPQGDRSLNEDARIWDGKLGYKFSVPDYAEWLESKLQLGVF